MFSIPVLVNCLTDGSILCRQSVPFGPTAHPACQGLPDTSLEVVGSVLDTLIITNVELEALHQGQAVVQVGRAVRVELHHVAGQAVGVVIHEKIVLVMDENNVIVEIVKRNKDLSSRVVGSNFPADMNGVHLAEERCGEVCCCESWTQQRQLCGISELDVFERLSL